MKRDYRGFTLIELLVSIAIIAILAAILFPVFVRVREKARAAACQSNLKQLAFGFHQYMNDYDSRYPQAADLAAGELGVNPPQNNTGVRPAIATVSDSGQSIPSIWPAKLEPYLKNRQVYTCPSRTRIGNATCDNAINATRAVTAFGWSSSQDDFNGCGYINGCTLGASMVSYGYNVYYLGGGQYPGYTNCQTYAGPLWQLGQGRFYNSGIAALESQIADSAGTVLLIDNAPANIGNSAIELSPAFATVTQYSATNSPGNSFGSDISGDAECNADGVSKEVRDTVDPRHNGGLNVAFCDGHVKWMKKEALLYAPNYSWGCNNVGANSVHFSTDPKFLWNRD